MPPAAAVAVMTPVGRCPPASAAVTGRGRGQVTEPAAGLSLGQPHTRPSPAWAGALPSSDRPKGAPVRHGWQVTDGGGPPRSEDLDRARRRMLPRPPQATAQAFAAAGHPETAWHIESGGGGVEARGGDNWQCGEPLTRAARSGNDAPPPPVPSGSGGGGRRGHRAVRRHRHGRQCLPPHASRVTGRKVGCTVNSMTATRLRGGAQVEVTGVNLSWKPGALPPPPPARRGRREAIGRGAGACCRRAR